MNNPQSSQKPGGNSLTRREIIVLSALGLFLIIAFWRKEPDRNGLNAATKPVESHSAGAPSPESTVESGRKSRSIKEPKPVPKESAELYLRDATELAATLESLLEMANSGTMTVEGLGKAEEWKSDVASQLRQMKEDGFEFGPLNSSTATGRVHAVLEQMQFAWESFGKFDKAETESDRRTYSMMHATGLKFVREHLIEAAKWMEREKF